MNENNTLVAEASQYSTQEELCATNEDGIYLFTTKTCPNCRLAKEFLTGIPYTVIDAEENPELTNTYSIMQAPTLVVVKDGEVKKYANVSSIKKFALEQPVGIEA